MKTMKKKLAKADNGKIVRSSVVDPEENKIKTRENKITGRTVTKIKYADPASSGMRRERIVTPGKSRRERKVEEMYKNNPTWGAEDDYAISKKGGPVVKKKMPKAKFGRGIVSTIDGSTYTKAGKKIGSGMGKKAEYRDFTTGEGDRSYGSNIAGMSEKMKLRKANKETSKSENIKVAKTGGMVNSNAKVSALKVAGSKGVKSGVNPKTSTQKSAKGKVGGISKAPKGAVPKAKYGMSMRKK